MRETDRERPPDADLRTLGWDAAREEEVRRLGKDDLVPLRVAAAVRGRYQVLGLEGWQGSWVSCRKNPGCGEGDTPAYPAVGDWVLARCDRTAVVIEHLLERRSSFVRKVAGREARPQVLAANVDRVLIVTAVDHDFNPRRLERYLAMVWESGAEPVIVVNKTDLAHDADAIRAELGTVTLEARVVLCSALEDRGLDGVLGLCEPRMTVALVGSSGVGKSTIINRLIGEERQATTAVRQGDGKGRHTTARQEMILTSGGAILIDTAGLREMGLWEAEDGVRRTFADIEALAEHCRFRDCTHTGEPGCAVEAAVEDGSLDRGRMDSYLRLQREIAYTGRRASARASTNTKRRWKEVSKAVRRLKKDFGIKGE